MSGVTVDFEREKETKRTIRYQEVGNDLTGVEVVVGMLYVRKEALRAIHDGIHPDELTITIEV